MTKNEAVIISAYTGYALCSFSDIHKYVEKVMQRPVFTHEMGREEFCIDLQEKSKPDFLAICENLTD